MVDFIVVDENHTITLNDECAVLYRQVNDFYHEDCNELMIHSKTLPHYLPLKHVALEGMEYTSSLATTPDGCMIAMNTGVIFNLIGDVLNVTDQPAEKEVNKS